jgi:putative tryptophan/tyrosine transport system substrate-binding protein
MTGVTNLDAKLGPKQLEILHELIPMATSIALLVNPANPNTETVSKDMQVAILPEMLAGQKRAK